MACAQPFYNIKLRFIGKFIVIPSEIKKKALQGLFLITEMFEYFHQVVTDHFGVSTFDMVSFDEVY